MSLDAYRVGAVVPVSDMKHATEFYEGKLGLAAADDEIDGGRTYQCGERTTLHVFPHPGAAGTSKATIAGWSVDNLESVVDDLTASGVAFERYDEPPIATNEKGIAVLGSRKAAWFKDPDGNTLGLIQG
jgi:catechol 2,3-dioxygenase-like lactoylglutathione lyase family enzyme